MRTEGAGIATGFLKGMGAEVHVRTVTLAEDDREALWV